MSNSATRPGLLQDWHRYAEGPPTTRVVCAALLFNAGFLTVFLFRLAQRLKRKGSRVRARLVHRLNMVLSSCELHPDAQVDAGLFLPHPYGVTIGRGSRVGRDVTLFQGVVLGARTSPGDDGEDQSGYPRISDAAVLYPHVLAYGDVTVGRHASVLGNSVVTQDVPDRGLYGGAPAGPVRSGRS